MGTKARRGKTLLALGGTMAGIGLIMLTPVLINRARRSARIDGGPMFVRGGGGGSLSLTF